MVRRLSVLLFYLLLALSTLLIGCSGTSDDDYHDRGDGDYVVFTYPLNQKDGLPKGKTEPGIVLTGGGLDTVAAFEWQLTHAKCGDFLILRSVGTDAYNSWVYDMSTRIGHQLNSVSTILFNNRNASFQPAVLTLIENAEAIFFAGGDQAVYLEEWSGTPVQTALQKKLATTTVGGTSAGLAILGQYIFSAATGGIDSSEALANPYARGVTLAPYFLSVRWLDTVLTDTHFKTRGRMGRMLTFLARELEAPYSVTLGKLRGVGVDEQTALLLNVTTGLVTAVGHSTAYICTPTVMPKVCVDGLPLTFERVHCIRMEGKNNDTYSLASFEEERGGFTYYNDIVGGAFTCSGNLCEYGTQQPAPRPLGAQVTESNELTTTQTIAIALGILLFLAFLCCLWGYYKALALSPPVVKADTADFAPNPLLHPPAPTVIRL